MIYKYKFENYELYFKFYNDNSIFSEIHLDGKIEYFSAINKIGLDFIFSDHPYNEMVIPKDLRPIISSYLIRHFKLLPFI